MFSIITGVNPLVNAVSLMIFVLKYSDVPRFLKSLEVLQQRERANLMALKNCAPFQNRRIGNATLLVCMCTLALLALGVRLAEFFVLKGKIS